MWLKCFNFANFLKPYDHVKGVASDPPRALEGTHVSEGL